MSPRPLKPLLVDTIIAGRTRLKAEIFLDRDRLDFFSKVGDREIRGTTAGECKDATRRALADFKGYAWERWIEAGVSGAPNWSHHTRDGKPHHYKLEGTFTRFERAEKFGETRRNKGGPGWLKRPFFEDLDKDAQAQVTEHGELWFADKWWDSTESENGEDPGDGRAVLLPYTVELWEALCSIEDTVEKARAHVRELLNPKDAGAKLLAIGIRQLGLKQLGSGK